MSDTQTQHYYKVFKSRRHWKPRIWTYMRFLFSVMVVEASNKWPTYQHPTSSSQECYMCPPGFYKVRDCAPIRDKSVQWSMCLPCPDSQYSQRWNTDGRCWDRDFCEKEHQVVYDGGNIGPIKCACNGSSLEDEHGVCVKGITSSTHRDVLNQLRLSCDAKVKAAKEVVMTTPVRSTVTQLPCTTPEASEASCPSCPECAVCEGVCESIPFGSHLLGFLIGFAVGVLGMLLYILLKNFSKRKKKREQKRNKMNESAAENGEVLKNDRQSPRLPNQGHESVPYRQESDCKDSDSKDSGVDNRKFPNGTTKTPTHVLILPLESQEGKKKSKPNNPNDEVSKTGGPNVVFINEDKEKATPAVCEEQERRRKLPDDALRIMEKEVTTRDEADRIIRHVLGLSAKQCRSIPDKTNTSDGVVREGFRIWEESKGSKEATVENLVLALIKHDHRMMAEKINDELKLDLKLAVPIRGATGADGNSELSASDSRPSRSSDAQGTSYSTSTPGRRSLDNGRSSREVNIRVDSPRTFPSSASSFYRSQESRVGNPTADIDVESGTKQELPSTSCASEGDLVSECERVKDADNSRPIEHVDLEDEYSGHGGKGAPPDDTQFHDQGDTKALKPGKNKQKELESDTKSKENDPLLENHENKKRKKKKE